MRYNRFLSIISALSPRPLLPPAIEIDRKVFRALSDFGARESTTSAATRRVPRLARLPLIGGKRRRTRTGIG